MSSHTLRPIPGLVALGLVLLLAGPAFAGKIYQWKDAKGVTHYSDSPPPGTKDVQNRELKEGRTLEQPEAKPPENPGCALARTNLARLKSDQSVGLDADGDGKPDSELSAEDRARQIQQTEQMLKASCDGPAAQP